MTSRHCIGETACYKAELGSYMFCSHALKDNWKKGESKLTPEQAAALARKIRGSYRDYFKGGFYVHVACNL